MTLPGTVAESGAGNCPDFLRSYPPIFWEKGGMFLSQIKDLTGLDGPAIQNWVKRGWVAPPVGKRYSANKVGRILLINALRETLSLPQIARILSYVNGNLTDSADDAIQDDALYDYFCRLTADMNEQTPLREEEIQEKIQTVLGHFAGSFDGAREQVAKALFVMALSYQSGLISRRAIRALEELAPST